MHKETWNALILMAHMWKKINRGVYKFDNNPKNLHGIIKSYEAESNFWIINN